MPAARLAILDGHFQFFEPQILTNRFISLLPVMPKCASRILELRGSLSSIEWLTEQVT